VLHRLAAAPFIVVPPVLPLSSRRRGLRCHVAGSAFIITLLLPSSLRRRQFYIFRRAAAGSAFVVALPLPSLSAAAFVITPPPVLHLSSRRRRFCICCCAAAAFLVAPLLPLSLRRRLLHRRAAATFVVAPPLPSLLRRRFCLRSPAIFNISHNIGYNIVYNTAVYCTPRFLYYHTGYWRFTYVGIPYTQTDDSLTFSSIGRRKYFICTASM
jgi:hypothetical protein